jgi:hypothetical protein
MKIGHLVHTASLIGAMVFMLAANANASSVTFDTSATGSTGTGFNTSGNLSLSSTAGVSATLAFVPDPIATAAVPGNVNYGNFTLSCPTCTTQAGGIGATFSAFTFDLVLTDVTDGATGVFKGSAAPGSVYLDASTITMNWLPIQLGPGFNDVTTGDFGPTLFTVTPTTSIVNPTSGAQVGSTTVQGAINSTAAPEPTTLSLVGGALLGLGLLRGKKLFRP